MPTFFLSKLLHHAETEGAQQPADFLKQVLKKGVGQLIALYASFAKGASFSKRSREEL
jgi:hypothetical protein